MIINRGYVLDPAVERIYNKYLDLQMSAQEGMDEVLAKVCSIFMLAQPSTSSWLSCNVYYVFQRSRCPHARLAFYGV